MNEYAQIAHQKFLAREREKLRADKRLRDAAPDLLAALKGILSEMENRGRVNADSIGQAVDAALTAIAKAEETS